MTIYNVLIRATITKTVQVEAESEAEAIATAHDEFTTECENDDEAYGQETLSVEEAQS